MIEVVEEAPDRLIIKLDPGGPVELTDLTESFAALARYYGRHYRPNDDAPAPKLYVTRLESGSVIAEIVPYAVMLGAIVYTMDSSLIVADFVRRLCVGIKAFSDPASAQNMEPKEAPSLSDAADIKEFLKPLAGKNGANLNVKQARFSKSDGEKETVVEYKFDEAQINRATVNIEEALEQGEEQGIPMLDQRESIKPEVMLFFEQASGKPGKETGRTGDRGIVPEVSKKALPVYFRKSFQNLKEQMVKGEINPLTHAFVVDVHVQIVDGEPKGYIVTDVHEVVPMEDQNS